MRLWHEDLIKGLPCQQLLGSIGQKACYSWLCLYTKPIYPDYNDIYMKECIENLESKGIEVDR